MEDNNILASKSTSSTLSQPAHIGKWFMKWMKLWPSHVMPGRYRISGNTMSCGNKMTKFVKTFPQYTPEIIMEATKNYLSKQEEGNWHYTKKNAKFIFDADGSVLEQECENILNGDSYVRKTNSISI